MIRHLRDSRHPSDPVLPGFAASASGSEWCVGSTCLMLVVQTSSEFMQCSVHVQRDVEQFCLPPCSITEQLDMQYSKVAPPFGSQINAIAGCCCGRFCGWPRLGKTEQSEYMAGQLAD